MATVKRTDDRPALQSYAGLAGNVSEVELDMPRMSNAMVEDSVRSEEMGETIELSERRLSEPAPSRVQPDEVIVQQDTPSGQVALANDVSGRGSAGGKFRRPLQLLAPHVRRVLYKPAAGSPLVAGTTVPEANVVELMRALRERSAQPAGWGARLAGRLLLQLMLERAPGPVTVEGVKVEQLKKLIDLIRQIESAGTEGGARAGTPRTSETHEVATGPGETSSGMDGEHQE
jgi:hypothetical protein